MHHPVLDICDGFVDGLRARQRPLRVDQPMLFVWIIYADRCVGQSSFVLICNKNFVAQGKKMEFETRMAQKVRENE